MLIRIITSLMIFTLGIIAGYLIFSSNEPMANSNQPAPSSATVEPEASSKETPLTGNSATASQESQPQLSDASPDSAQLKAQLESKDQQIAQLKRALAESNKRLTKSKPSNEDKVQSLQSISMEDFEEKLKGSFRDRFKGYAIEISGDQLDNFRKAFEGEQSKETWSAEYENHINEFISNTDPNGLHYVEEVNCNKALCRLKVQSGETESWQRLYSEMTQQEWFNSITLFENTDDPGSHIYYIPRPQDL